VKYIIKKDRCRRGDMMRAISDGPKMAPGVYNNKKDWPAAGPPCPPYTRHCCPDLPNLDFLNRFSLRSPMPDFKEIRPVGAALIHANRQTGMMNALRKALERF